MQGKDIPRINTLVDAYNIASMETHVPLAVFDADKLAGEMRMLKATGGERFRGIGMTDEETLSGKEVVLEDARGLIAIYPHRDADFSKVTLDTNNVTVLVCGVPGIELERLDRVGNLAAEYITRFCGGTPER